MNSELGIVVFFTLGIIAQTIYLVKSGHNTTFKIFMLASGIFGALIWSQFSPDDPFNSKKNFLYAICVFPYLLAMVYMDDILPMINVYTVLSSTLALWYMVFSFYRNSASGAAVFLLFLVPTLITLAVAFARARPGALLRYFLYAWFLVATVIIGIRQFYFSFSEIFSSVGLGRKIGLVGPVDCFAAGMAFCCLGVYSSYLCMLLPIFGRDHWIKEWWDDAYYIAGQYDENAQVSLRAAGILCVLGGLLILNYHYRFIQDNLMLNLCLLLPITIDRMFSLNRRKNKTALPFPNSPEPQ